MTSEIRGWSDPVEMMKRDMEEKKRLAEKIKEKKDSKEVDYPALHGKSDEYGEVVSLQGETLKELSDKDKKFLEEMREKIRKNRKN